MWKSISYQKILSKISKFIKRNKWLTVGVVLIPIILGTLFTSYSAAFVGRAYPNIYVSGIDVGGRTTAEIQALLASSTINPIKINFTSANQNFELDLATVDFFYDFEKTANAAVGVGRTGNYLYDFTKRVSAIFTKTELGLRININEQKLEEFLSVVSGSVSEEPVYPSVRLVNDVLVVEKGRPGSELDKLLSRIALGQHLSKNKQGDIALVIKSNDPSITDLQAVNYKARAEKFVGKAILLKFEEQTFEITQNDLFALLDPKEGYNEEALAESIFKIVPQINRDPQDSVFNYENGVVREFIPSHDGIAVEVDKLKILIVNDLKNLESTELALAEINIPTTKTQPNIKTENVNSLGIRELIGRGTSRFAGSIASRVHNIGVATSKFNGTLVAPGEEFSFNQILGDVSAYTGYKQAYVIRDGQTVLGDGGGVCQVSTTLFRAALAAGLPITERRSHSYRVGYYEQDAAPGLDATVYAPTTDLKIKNDTPGHILIQTEFVPNTATLIFDIYGTSDGRVATHTTPVVYDYVAPPEDLYIDDPTKPAGYIEQIDWKAAGSKSRFDYTVERNGEVIYKKTFFSNYKAWQSKFVRGTGSAI